MLAESPLALRFILGDDVYLLPGDRAGLAVVEEPSNANVAIAETVVLSVEKEATATTAVAEPVRVEVPKQASTLVEELKIPKFNATERKASLIEHQDKPAITPQPEFEALGNNGKNILVLVNYPDVEFIVDAHLQALESAFARLGHTRTDFAIFNIARYPAATFEKLSAYFKPQILLVLGADSYPQGLPQQPFNQLREGKGGRKLLFTYSFNEMMGDKEKTRAYWEQMKSL